jgi:hypothetical protein
MYGTLGVQTFDQEHFPPNIGDVLIVRKIVGPSLFKCN